MFIALGFLTSFAALGFVGLMSVAYWTVHSKNGFMIINEGWEYVFILAISAVTVAMIGPGEWSLDYAIGWDSDLDGYTGLAISAGGGLLAATGLLGIFYRPPKEETKN
jgi:putative oxidoreductase